MKMQKLIMMMCVMVSPLMGDISTIGTVCASSKSKLGSQVGGRVSEVLVDVGDEVKKGQQLITLDPIYFEIDVAQKEAALESAQINLHDEETNFLRMKKLWEKPEGENPSISQKRFEDSKSKYEQALVLVKQAQANLDFAKANLNEATIKAPYDGVITKIMVDAGESIKEAPITYVVEMLAVDPIYLEFSIPQGYLGFVKPSTPIAFEIEGIQLDSNKAEISIVYPSVDESTRSIQCRAVISNLDGKIRPGALAKITLIKD